MIIKIYKTVMVLGSITMVVIISYYLNFPIDLKSISIYIKNEDTHWVEPRPVTPEII